MPFAETWMDLEVIILSEVRERQISYDIIYMWNLKYDTNELIYKTERDRHRELMVAKGERKRWRGGINYEVTYTYIYI